MSSATNAVIIPKSIQNICYGNCPCSLLPVPVLSLSLSLSLPHTHFPADTKHEALCVHIFWIGVCVSQISRPTSI